MYKTEAQIVAYGILYLNPSSNQCQPSFKKYIPVEPPPNRHKSIVDARHLLEICRGKLFIAREKNYMEIKRLS